MNLYSIHCGFYDGEISDGIYEFHINIPTAAESLEEAKQQVRKSPVFIKKKMHIDGIEEIKIVDGFRLALTREEKTVQSMVVRHFHRDL